LEPFTYDTNHRVNSCRMNLCHSMPFDRCLMTATINQPFTRWNVRDGTFVNFTILSNIDKCETVLCQNDPLGADPYTCSFYYSASVGEVIYFTGFSGNAPNFPVTFNMRTNCSDKGESTFGKQTLGCPVNPKSTKRFVRITDSGTVPTSTRTELSNSYSFEVCPENTNFAQILFHLRAIGSRSAFATYFCDHDDCSTNGSPTGWFDDSGTALNRVEINNLKSQPLWFNIYGWGEFEGFNRYLFDIIIRDS